MDSGLIDLKQTRKPILQPFDIKLRLIAIFLSIFYFLGFQALLFSPISLNDLYIDTFGEKTYDYIFYLTELLSAPSYLIMAAFISFIPRR